MTSNYLIMNNPQDEILKIADPHIMEIISQCVDYTAVEQAPPKIVYSSQGTIDADESRDSEDN